MLAGFLPQEPAKRRDAIAGFKGFLVQKVSHNGTLYLYQDHFVFAYASGEDEKDTEVSFDSITDIIVESRLAHAMNNLEVRCKDQTFLFTGIHEAKAVKDMIMLMREHKKNPKPTYGFARTGEKTVEWEDLTNPILMCSATIPANISAVMQQIEQKDIFWELYKSGGNEDIVFSEWVEMDGYKERSITYNKCVVLPVLGKNMIKVIEYQRLFNLNGQYAIHVVSDLGKTPYANCFDPVVQIFFVDNGDKVEYLVKFEMIWSSEPFVKSIIQTKTTDEIREQYISFGQQLVREFGGGADVDEEKTAEQSSVDDFGKTRKIYKIVIITLVAILLLVLLFKHRKKYGWGISWGLFTKLVFIGMFFVLLIFF